jgi:hypothetical protein
MDVLSHGKVFKKRLKGESTIKWTLCDPCLCKWKIAIKLCLNVLNFKILFIPTKLRIKEFFHLLPVISETAKNWECS